MRHTTSRFSGIGTMTGRELTTTIVVPLVFSVCMLAPARAHDPEPEVDITRWIGAIQPRLDAAGEKIAFSYQGAIWRMPRGGGVMTRLTSGTGFDIAPAWSPDGSRIAYIASDNFASGALRLIQAENGSEIHLPRPILARQARIRPLRQAHTRIFREPGKDFALAWLTVENGRLDPVPTGSARFQNFVLSNHGKTIALSSTLDVTGQQTGNNGPDNDLWTLPAEGGTLRKVVRFPARIHSLCWAAADRSLIVSTELGGSTMTSGRSPWRTRWPGRGG